MIVKILDLFSGTSPEEKAGYKAEKQLAHYLERAFHNHKEIFVIDNLRFETAGIFTQIDHLVLTRHAAFIIESKSVTSAVKYNDKEEWERVWDNHWRGIPNPLKQAERQAKALRDFLQENRESLRGKFLGIKQKGFLSMPIHCVVAISDAGSIKRSGEDIYTQKVMKADLVTDYILKEHDQYLKNKSFMDSSWNFLENEMEKTIAFLLEAHEPFPVPEEKENACPATTTQSESVKKPKSPVKKTVPAPLKTEKAPPPTPTQPLPAVPSVNIIEPPEGCPECKQKMKIMWGAKFKNYYWHCEKCHKNVAINHKCPNCKDKLHLTKQGLRYDLYCPNCDFLQFYAEHDDG